MLHGDCGPMEGQAQGSQDLAAGLSSMWLQCGLGLWMTAGFFNDFNIMLTGVTEVYPNRLEGAPLISIQTKSSRLEIFLLP